MHRLQLSRLGWVMGVSRRVAPRCAALCCLAALCSYAALVTHCLAAAPGFACAVCAQMSVQTHAQLRTFNMHVITPSPCTIG